MKKLCSAALFVVSIGFGLLYAWSPSVLFAALQLLTLVAGYWSLYRAC